VSEPGKGGVPGGLSFCGWARIVEREHSEVVEGGVDVVGVSERGTIQRPVRESLTEEEDIGAKPEVRAEGVC
jgi:hypothetical protein